MKALGIYVHALVTEKIRLNIQQLNATHMKFPSYF